MVDNEEENWGWRKRKEKGGGNLDNFLGKIVEVSNKLMCEVA